MNKKQKYAMHYMSRKCTLCLKLEDEFHFLFECPWYKDLRRKFVRNVLLQKQNMLKFIELITSENETVMKKVSMFVCFDLRINS